MVNLKFLQHHKPKATNIYAIVKNNVFLSRKFANTRSTKALRDYFTLAESQPTCATLGSSSIKNLRKVTCGCVHRFVGLERKAAYIFCIFSCICISICWRLGGPKRGTGGILLFRCTHSLSSFTDHLFDDWGVHRCSQYKIDSDNSAATYRLFFLTGTP